MPDRALDCVHVKLEVGDGCAVVTINRPHAFNTLSLGTLTDLTHTFDWLSRQPDVRAVILHGSGRTAFAAGADIRELAELEGVAALAFADRGQHLCRLIEDGNQIVIAAIDGYCLGGGLDLAMACHLRYASPQSLFAHPGGRIGIITGFGGTQRLPRLVGKSRALELFLTGARVTAAEALVMGLIHRVVNDEPVLEAARSTAMKIIGT